MNHMEHIDKAIEKGISFLAEHQFHHGEFCVYMGEGDYLEKWCIPDSTTFTSAMIGTLLLPLKEDPTVENMLKKIVPFLQYQKMRGGVWNYFTKWHKLFSICPPDIDSTVCISSFLKDMNAPFPDNISMLLANRNKKGLFYTWFTMRFSLNKYKGVTYWKLILRELKHPIKSMMLWRKGLCKRTDIDIVVNANVLFYLGFNKYTAPIINLLVKTINEEKENSCDKWYKNPFEAYYFISRNYKNGITELDLVRNLITERILASAQDDGRLGISPLDTALGISTLINFNYTNHYVLDKSTDYLIKNQAANGSWRIEALCGSGYVSPVVWGSEELSTAVSLEALALYRKYKAAQITPESFLHEIS